MEIHDMSLQRMSHDRNGRASGLCARLLNPTVSKYLRTGAKVSDLISDSWLMIKALQEDMDIYPSNADDIIEELQDEIEELEEKLRKSKSSKRRQDIRERIEFAKGLIIDVKRIKRGVPAKTIRASSKVLGKVVVGAASGYIGVWAGAQTGAAVGLCFGPAGAVLGAGIGAVVAGYATQRAGEEIGDWAGETISDDMMNRYYD
ncbi:uncharacterized protein LOC143358745 [Halictus rubicundus]|uniref:uncharacterized protein LOC143358745 n=1 Tax=Halictus rubicundus TaxID=77578 RepID=UPI004036DFC2